MQISDVLLELRSIDPDAMQYLTADQVRYYQRQLTRGTDSETVFKNLRRDIAEDRRVADCETLEALHFDDSY